MSDWSMVGNVLFLFYGTCLLATFVLLGFMFNPKYIVYAFYRFQYFKLGVRKKQVGLSRKCTFSYFEKGSRNSSVASILLVHGLTGSKENYLALAHFLPKTYHIIAVDLLGHGESLINDNNDYDVPTFVNYLKKFVDAVGLSSSPFHLVGMSFGGHIVGLYSVSYALDLLSLTLICPHGISFEREKEMVAEARRTNSFILLPQSVEEYQKLIEMTQHTPRAIPKWIMPGLFQIRKERESVNYDIMKSLYEPCNMHLLEKNAHKISTPLLLIWGKEDKIIDIECLQILKEKLPIPPHNVVVLENVGHAINFERPRKLSFVLLQFFNSLL